MPHVELQISGEPDPRLTREAAATVAELTQRILGKRPEVIAVAVRYLSRDAWFIGGESLATLGKNAFHLEISITDETNTKAEKARFLGELFRTLADRIGNVHPVSYIHVIDARAAAYGYGGQTQEFRAQHP